MIICNFTPDTIQWMHNGIGGKLKPGDIQDFPDPRGRHILNAFTRRGILQLQYGDDPDKIREKAMKIYKEFWERQVTIFNQDNERRKNTNKEYVEPTQELKEHAEKFGLELVGPWTIKKLDNDMMRNVIIENEGLKVQIARLMEQVGKLAEAVGHKNVPDELRSLEEKVIIAESVAKAEPKTEEEPKSVTEKPESETEDVVEEPDPNELPKDAMGIIKEFSKLGKDRFSTWVLENADRIQHKDFPLAVRRMIMDKWERMMAGKFDFPFPN